MPLGFGNLLLWVLSFFLMTPWQGGYTPAWAAAAREVRQHRERYKGVYLVPYGKIEEPSKDARREDLAKELCETTERILSDFKWV